MNWANYLIQINLYLMLFYGFYFLFLRNETFFTLNRIYLVGSAVISLCIPVFYFEWVKTLFVTEEIHNGLGEFYIIIQEGFGTSITSSDWVLGDYLTAIYLLGLLFFTLRFVSRLMKIRLELKSEQGGEAFSFFNKIKIDTSLNQKEVILEHEKTHAKQMHSADVLFFEVIAIITWFNPIIYCYKRAIKYIHEFIADDVATLSCSNKKDYAMLIFSKSLGVNPHKLTNTFFNQSLLKKRIIMLQKQKSRKTAILKYGLSVPLFLIAMVFSSAAIDRSETLSEITEKIESSKPLSELVLNSSRDNDKSEILREANAIDLMNSQEKSIKSSLDNMLNGKMKEISKEDSSNGSISAKDILAYLGDNNKDISNLLADSKHKNDSTISNNYFTKEIVVVGYENSNSNKEIFTNVELLPKFPGGIQEFYKFLVRNLNYPKEAKDNKTQGSVIINFVVEKDGSLTDFKVLRGISKELDEEALRVMKLSPKWEPGFQNGKTVRVSYSVPISFKLNNNISSEIEGHPYILLEEKSITKAEMQAISVDKIERIEVLKDKSATDKYGDKGKNGVILITLKKTE
jgi:TonB family protein